MMDLRNMSYESPTSVLALALEAALNEDTCWENQRMSEMFWTSTPGEPGPAELESGAVSYGLRNSGSFYTGE